MEPEDLTEVDVDSYPALLAEILYAQTLEWEAVPRALVERIGVVLSEN